MSRDVSAELKELRLQGMSQAWDEVSSQEGGTHVDVQTGQWLISHWLQAEHAHRAYVSVRHPMKAGKTHLASAIGVSGMAAKGKRVRFYSTVDLVNELEREKREGKAGRIALAWMGMDLVIDALGYLSFRVGQYSTGADIAQSPVLIGLIARREARDPASVMLLTTDEGLQLLSNCHTQDWRKQWCRRPESNRHGCYPAGF